MILLLDNFDSYTWNLYDYLVSLGASCSVVRNNISPIDYNGEEISGIVLSPGPGKPENAGYLFDWIDAYHSKLPMLGICLGHQAIAKFFGAEIGYAHSPMHGKISELKIVMTDSIFYDVPNLTSVVRYHSLIATSWPEKVIPLAYSNKEGELMAFRIKDFPVWGLQFHPEAALTIHGKTIIKNWLSYNNLLSH